MSFRVGQKVVCVEDRACSCCGAASNLRKRAIYTVRETYIHYNGLQDYQAVILHEVAAPSPHHGYKASFFRPIIERSTDAGMAILRRILTDHKAPARVDAQMHEHDIFDQERA